MFDVVHVIGHMLHVWSSIWLLCRCNFAVMNSLLGEFARLRIPIFEIQKLFATSFCVGIATFEGLLCCCLVLFFNCQWNHTNGKWLILVCNPILHAIRARPRTKNTNEQRYHMKSHIHGFNAWKHISFTYLKTLKNYSFFVCSCYLGHRLRIIANLIANKWPRVHLSISIFRLRSLNISVPPWVRGVWNV